MSSQRSLHDLASAYALNAVDGEERAVFEAHLVTCERCQVEVADVAETVAGMADETAVNPPKGLRADVLDAVGQTEQLPPVNVPVDLAKRRSLSGMKVWPLATAAALVVIAAVSYAFIVSGGGGASDLGIEEVAGATDVVTAELAAADGLSGSITVNWSPELGAVSVVTDGLASPGPDEVYELWFVLQDGLGSAGQFSPVDGVFSGVLEVDELDAIGWGVTIEPSGGSDQPTGDILYLGDL